MAYALIAHTGAGSSDGLTATTSAIDTSGASLLIIVASGVSVTNVSDSKGNTWTPLNFYNAGGVGTEIHYVKNPIVGSGHTFTVGGGPVIVPSLCVAAFSGADTTSPFDVQNGSTNSGTASAQPGSILPGSANELVIAGINLNGTATLSIDSGYTITDQIPLAGGLNYGSGLAYIIQTTAASTNPTWSWSGSFSSQLAIASFIAGASAPFIGFTIALV